MGRYDADRLREIEQRDNCIVDASMYMQALLSTTVIQFVCRCGEHVSKRFVSMWVKGGAYCSTCVEQNRHEKHKVTNMKVRGYEHQSQDPVIKEQKRGKTLQTRVEKSGITVYDRDLLHDIIERCDARVDDKVYSEVLDQQYRVSFVCKCGTPHEKRMLELHKGPGAYCRDCSMHISKEVSNSTKKDIFGEGYTIYDVNLLRQDMERDNFQVEPNVLESYMSSKTIIAFTCACGLEGHKQFHILHGEHGTGGGFCEYCIVQRRDE